MPGTLQAADLPLIDAHSQIDQHVDPADIVHYLNEAGIAHVILSARGKTKGRTIVQLARDNPQRITAAVRTKGGFYKNNTPKYYKVLDAQLGLPDFKAMAEVILWHAEKPSRLGTIEAAQVVVPPADDRVQTALRVAIERGWPFIFHIEFAAAGDDADRFMTAMKATLAAHPEHPFALIHMGQLEAYDVRRLIERHPNIHFITAHTTPITTESSQQPWVNMFDDGQLTADWANLITQHPDRFVLGFDNVWADHWGDRYVETASFWRRALAALPDAVAHAVAHRNAERLWRLPPVQ
jgi:predicted TIM-barrel fold metal-dependent hydrolase